MSAASTNRLGRPAVVLEAALFKIAIGAFKATAVGSAHGAAAAAGTHAVGTHALAGAGHQLATSAGLATAKAAATSHAASSLATAGAAHPVAVTAHAAGIHAATAHAATIHAAGAHGAATQAASQVASPLHIPKRVLELDALFLAGGAGFDKAVDEAVERLRACIRGRAEAIAASPEAGGDPDNWLRAEREILTEQRAHEISQTPGARSDEENWYNAELEVVTAQRARAIAASPEARGDVDNWIASATSRPSRCRRRPQPDRTDKGIRTRRRQRLPTIPRGALRAPRSRPERSSDGPVRSDRSVARECRLHEPPATSTASLSTGPTRRLAEASPPLA
jgi:hypothetical protein